MKKIKIMSIIVIICMILLLSTKVYAAERFELQISSEASNLNPGDTFTVDIVLDNMNVTSGDQGIGAYSAKITYDTSVLELVSVEQEEGWEVMENENNIVALTSNGEVVKERTKTATGTFKVKDNAKLGETSISLENISGSSGEATIAGTAVSKVITIEEKREENEENNPSGGDNTIGEGNTKKKSPVSFLKRKPGPFANRDAAIGQFGAANSLRQGKRSERELAPGLCLARESHDFGRN